jgi:hypothetical protein
MGFKIYYRSGRNGNNLTETVAAIALSFIGIGIVIYGITLLDRYAIETYHTRLSNNAGEFIFIAVVIVGIPTMSVLFKTILERLGERLHKFRENSKLKRKMKQIKRNKAL